MNPLLENYVETYVGTDVETMKETRKRRNGLQHVGQKSQSLPKGSIEASEASPNATSYSRNIITAGELCRNCFGIFWEFLENPRGRKIK